MEYLDLARVYLSDFTDDPVRLMFIIFSLALIAVFFYFTLWNLDERLFGKRCPWKNYHGDVLRVNEILYDLEYQYLGEICYVDIEHLPEYLRWKLREPCGTLQSLFHHFRKHPLPT